MAKKYKKNRDGNPKFIRKPEFVCPSCGGANYIKTSSPVFDDPPQLAYKVCSNCFKDGYTILVVIDAKKSGVVAGKIINHSKVCRTGECIYLKSEVVPKVFPKLESAGDLVYIDEDIAQAIKEELKLYNEKRVDSVDSAQLLKLNEE
jgi:hypothetical protein